MNAFKGYFAGLVEETGRGWNRFWFLPRLPATLGVLRVTAGLSALWFLGWYTADLMTWLGPQGIADPQTVEVLTGGDHYYWSPLFYLQTPLMLWLFHGASLAVATAFTLGLFSRGPSEWARRSLPEAAAWLVSPLLLRLTSILTLLAVLSYVNRLPSVLTGPMEPVLTMALFYLCIAPAGASCALDSLLFRPRNRDAAFIDPARREYLSATIATRLMQIHLAAMYLMMGLTKLRGDVWWNGDAMWWLIAHTESRLVNLTWLHSAPPVFNLWTYAVVAHEIAFPLLVWNRRLRPLLLALSALIWLSLALVTGLLGFCGIMIAANLVFLAPADVNGAGRLLTRRRD